MTDLVSRLRERHSFLCDEAAEEIERLHGIIADNSLLHRTDNERLRGWLGEAADDIEHWGGYASEYFKDKWHLEDDIKKYRDAALAGAAVQPSDVASTFADCELAMGMEYETDPSGVPTEADLLAWGYAPGNYSSRCFTCGRMIDGVDKRCGICRACAITRWTHAKARAAVPTTEVQK